MSTTNQKGRAPNLKTRAETHPLGVTWLTWYNPPQCSHLSPEQYDGAPKTYEQIILQTSLLSHSGGLLFTQPAHCIEHDDRIRYQRASHADPKSTGCYPHAHHPGY
jgi:hypothetical protein